MADNSYHTDILIIGAGPVGLFSVFQAGMLGMRCHVVDSLPQIGGQCTALYPEKPIYDIPAYRVITAQGLIEELARQAEPFAPCYHLSQQLVALSRQEDQSFVGITSDNVKITAKAVIIAAGAGAFGPNKPPLDGIEDFEGQSVFYSVTNKELFRDGRIAIAGGGDSAIDWALNLADIAEKIYLIHRRAKFRCAPESFRQVEKLVANGKVELVVPYQLSAIEGENGAMRHLIVSQLDGSTNTLNANFLLAFFGLATNLGPILNWGLNIHMHHINVTQPHYNTNIDGIYAIGDIASYPGKLKLILTGFAEAAAALHHSYNLVFPGKALHFEYSTSKGVA